MSIYTVDEDGQVFITPSELDNFDYYRDNIFVRTYEEFLNYNPPNATNWISYLGPEYWESADTNKIDWDGTKWAAKTPYGICTLTPIGTWINNFRQPYAYITATPGEHGNFAAEFEDTSSNNIMRWTTTNERGCINWSYDNDIAELKVGSISELPFAITNIQFGELDVLGLDIIDPIVETIPNVEIYDTAIDLDSYGNIHHIAGFNGIEADYWTNSTGSWVKTDLGFISTTYLQMVINSNNDIHIIYKDDGDNNLYHKYYDGSWSTPTFIAATTAYLTRALDFWIDEYDTLHLAYGDYDYLRYWYKTSAGSWTQDDPGLTGGGYYWTQMCVRNSKVYIMTRVDNQNTVVIKDGTWGSPVTFIEPTFYTHTILIDSNETLYAIGKFSGAAEGYSIFMDSGDGWELVQYLPMPIDWNSTGWSISSLRADGTLQIFVTADVCEDRPKCVRFSYKDSFYIKKILEDSWEFSSTNRMIRNKTVTVFDKATTLNVDTHIWIDPLDVWNLSGDFRSLNQDKCTLGYRGVSPDELQRYFLLLNIENITIPFGAVITSAVLKVTAFETDSDVIELKIGFQAHDNPSNPTSDPECSDIINNVTNMVSWVPSGWTASSRYTSTDIAAALQQIIDRSGWNSGQAIELVIEDKRELKDIPFIGDAIKRRVIWYGTATEADRVDLDVVWTNPSGSASFSAVYPNTSNYIEYVKEYSS